MDIPPRTNIATFRNQLLQLLPAEEVRRLRPHLTRIWLVDGTTLCLPGERIEHVFFVEQGFTSLMAVTDDKQRRVEVGLIGREGLVGALALVAPGATSYVQAVVQMPGAAYGIPTAALLANLEQAPMLRRIILRALETSVAQLAQTTACNSRHTVPQLLARWLLMAHDRVDGDELSLTQELLATLLAVRRPGITVAIGDLKTAGLVQHSRGRTVICDRLRLEAAACGCYRRVKDFAATLAARDPGLISDYDLAHAPFITFPGRASRIFQSAVDLGNKSMAQPGAPFLLGSHRRPVWVSGAQHGPPHPVCLFHDLL